MAWIGMHILRPLYVRNVLHTWFVGIPARNKTHMGVLLATMSSILNIGAVVPVQTGVISQAATGVTGASNAWRS